MAGAYAGFLHLAALWLPVNLVGLFLLWQQNLSLGKLAGIRESGAGAGAGAAATEPGTGYIAGSGSLPPSSLPTKEDLP